MKEIVKTIYDLLPLKKQILSALRAVWTPPEKIYKHLHFKGVFKVQIDQTHEFKIKHYGFVVENDIFWAGLTSGWEKESLTTWIKLCEKADVIFDLGANTGVYSLIAKSVNPNSKVHAFEPVKRVCDKLKENIALNNYDVIAVEKAVSNADGTAIIYDTLTEHVYSVTVNKDLSLPETEVQKKEIQTIKLDTYFSENNISKIDLIKIDVETHEPEVLEGFINNLRAHKPTMLIEILTDELGSAIQKIVDGMGYLYYNIDEAKGMRRVDKITKSDCYNFLLCGPDVAAELGLDVN